jgi:hypothetical protein
MADLNDRETQRTGPARGTVSGAAEVGDWSAEEKYWRDNFASRPYARADRNFDFFSPAYRYGFERARQYRGKQWNDVESELRAGWDRGPENKTKWEEVKDAVRDAWNRVTRR